MGPTDFRAVKTPSFSPDFESKIKITLTLRKRRRQARNIRKVYGIIRGFSSIFSLTSKYFTFVEFDNNSDFNRSIRFRRSSFFRYNNSFRYNNTFRPDGNINNNQTINSYNKITGDFFKKIDSNDIIFSISELFIDLKIFFLPYFITVKKFVVKITKTISNEITATNNTEKIQIINNNRLLFFFVCRHRHTNFGQIKIKILSPIIVENIKIVINLYYSLFINTVILILHK